MSEGWIGVDLDGTLAEYLGWQGMGHIGEPIAPMAERVRAWLAVGKDVRIFTARVCSIQSQEDIDIFLREYTRWCFRVFGRQLPVTCEKDWKMIELWDDRCVQIMPNTGIMVQDALVREVQSMKNDDMKRRARIAELEAERAQLRKALEAIAKFADREYEKRIPAPSCVEFLTIKLCAKNTLKGAVAKNATVEPR